MFTPTTIQQKTIDLFVKKELSCFHLFLERDKFYEYKNDHFDYYIFENSICFSLDIDNTKEITFDDVVQDYLSKTYKYQQHYSICTKEKKMLRFSRTYGTLEAYSFNYSFKTPKHLRNKDSDFKVLVNKKDKKITIRNNGHVLLNGNRYISLKNFQNATKELSYNVELLNSHLKSSFKPELLNNFHLQIANKFSKNCSTLDDVLSNMLVNPPAKILKQKYGAKDLLCLYTMIDEKETPKVISFIKDNLDFLYLDESIIDFNLPTLYSKENSGFRYESILSILGKYMAIKLNLARPLLIPELKSRALIPLKKTSSHITLLRDYINMSYDLSEKININITSTKRLKLLHDTLQIKFLLRKPTPKITVDKKFVTHFKSIKQKDLDTQKISVHLLTTAQELRNESLEMNHCVAMYHPAINEKRTCIWKVKDNETNEKATLQIDDYNNKLTAVQFKGVWNTQPSKELTEKITNILVPLQTSVSMIASRGVNRGLNPVVRRVEEFEENLPF